MLCRGWMWLPFMAGAASSLACSTFDRQLLPHTPAAHLITGLNTLVCAPFTARLFSSPQHGRWLTYMYHSQWRFACLYYCSFFILTLVLLGFLCVGFSLSPSSTSLPQASTRLHLWPSVPHSTSVSSRTTADIAWSLTITPADHQPEPTCVCPSWKSKRPLPLAPHLSLFSKFL